MSYPALDPTIEIQFDAVEGLAVELAVLSTQLADDAVLCRSSAAALLEALARDEGWAATSAATAWATLTGVVAERTDAVAATLLAAVASYRAADGALAGGIGAARRRPGGAR